MTADLRNQQCIFTVVMLATTGRQADRQQNMAGEELQSVKRSRLREKLKGGKLRKRHDKTNLNPFGENKLFFLFCFPQSSLI